MSDAFVSVAQAAAILGVHKNTVSRRIQAGKYAVAWVPGDHGPERAIPRWQIDGLPEPDGWDPTAHAGPDLAQKPEPSALAPVEPTRDLAHLMTAYEQLISDIRALERECGALEARNAALNDHNALLRAELDAIKGAVISPPDHAQRRFWRLIKGKQP